ncbi:NifU-like domain protein [compost metagenome]
MTVAEGDEARLARINELLDTKVRPALAMDGGGLEVLALEGNILRVHYQGACGTCPSSLSGTLMGIENLLQSIEPGLMLEAV